MAEIDEEAIRREMEELRAKRAAAEQPQDMGPEKFALNPMSSIKHVVGVSSGKGGVGKSLVTGMLAVELARSGAKVGILDADITGPSIPKMFGLSGEHIYAAEDLLIPAKSAGGITIMSANLVLENETDPVIWRGPVVSGALKQFWEDVAWGELDYLLVDMPPGTGDVALTVFQSLPLDGVVVVSSPQDLVQMVVGKAVNMAAMMGVPVLGIVENMAYATCPDCGRAIEVFGPSHLDETAAAYDVNALDRLPIDPAIAAMVDDGSFEEKLPQGLLPLTVETVLATAEFLDAARQG